ncbi:hypothetical protein LTR05_007438 [Lithohypha guttulata]|uniref:RNA 3'-terminal phosphate cyclase-like protein n=1 Tax=Lithohypha guttulata TaxID=1690604 RepID=A0AAN7SV31_9EURO|nr:hypothetical protein LTR05_007438 [Lithohypha guttulata]
MEPVTKPIKFTTHKSLANRLILATLHGRPIHVSQIRASNPTNPGLAPSEISLLRLLESLTNGSHIEISYTGTTLLYKPGLITGSVPGRGADAHGILRHEVDGRVTRGISYLVLAVCLLAPFSKGKVNVLFTGPGVITSAAERWGDVSVDTVRTAILPLYAQFGIERDLEIRVNRRSNPSHTIKGRSGAGEVQVVFGHQVRLPKTVHMLRSGRVKRIRGVAYATGVSGGNNARMIEVARGVLNRLVGDIYIFSDVGNAQLIDSGKEPGEKKKVGLGFGLSLVAESTAPGVIYSADAASGAEGGETPEEVGRRAAYALLESISRGGCISSEAASTVLMLMSMGSEDVGRVQLSRDVLASEEIIQLARDMGAFGTAGWGIRDATEDGVKSEGQLIVSVVGSGIGNVGRKIG